MLLSPGARLGPYEILGPLGAGGMGEVYRARDTRLEREVALKILPAYLADHADARARFEREAKAVAALSDPNVLAIYDVGSEGNTAYAAMELLDGETLHSRLAAGALAARKTADIAVQIANGLAAAHARGIVHRDLKPENVFITREGRVKILDFGLAKTPITSPGSDRLRQGYGESAGASAKAEDPGLQPTAPANTAPGVVMGTCGYMAPEQVRGQPVDHRADIFAFGAILYEMVSGARAFTGNSAVETMNAVLTEDPPALAPADDPLLPALDRILRRCIEKHPDERFQSARDLAFALQSISSVGGSASAAAVRSGVARGGRRARPYLIGTLTGIALTAAVAAALWIARPAQATRPARVVRFSIEIPDARTLNSFALAPDGSLFAYVAAESGVSRIYVRALDQSTDAALAGTEGAVSLFFSPDGQWIAFFAKGRLQKIPSRGGDATPLADAETEADRAVIPTGEWADDGTIVFSHRGRGLLRMPASGGEPVSIAVPSLTGDDQFYLWPRFLPGGQSVLFTVGTGGYFDRSRIEEVPIGGGSRRRVIESGARAQVLPSGHLLYADGGRLVAAPLARSAPGGAVAIVDHLAYNGRQPLFDFSDRGDLAFATQIDPAAPDVLRVDRRGHTERLDVALSGMAQSLTLSPDGTRLAGWVIPRDRSMSLWVLDLARGVVTQLQGEGRNHLPVWLPDGRTLTFSSDRSGAFNLYVQSADGSGTAERLTTGPLHEDPSGWTPDGRWLVYAVADPKNGTDILVFDRAARKVQPFRQTPADERFPALSPDGRWLAYASDESGRMEVYADAFPGGGSRVQLSVNGGNEPLWSAKGSELFYRNGHRLMSVGVRTGSALIASRPQMLFEGAFDESATFGQPGYAVEPDGRHFYFLRGSGSTAGPKRVEVILNWIDEFKRRVAK